MQMAARLAVYIGIAGLLVLLLRTFPIAEWFLPGTLIVGAGVALLLYLTRKSG
jgi:hypothetical protein